MRLELGREVPATGFALCRTLQVWADRSARRGSVRRKMLASALESEQSWQKASIDAAKGALEGRSLCWAKATLERMLHALPRP